MGARWSRDHQGQVVPEKRQCLSDRTWACTELTHRVSFLWLNRRDPVLRAHGPQSPSYRVSPSFPFPFQNALGVWGAALAEGRDLWH